MDFLTSLYVAGIISTVLLYVALYVYYRRTYLVEDQLAPETVRALRTFGLSIFALGAIFPTAILQPSFLPTIISLSFLGMVSTQMLLSFESESRMSKIGWSFVTLWLLSVCESIARILFVPYPLPPIMVIVTLSIFMTTALVGSVYVLRESPSPFTGSMFVILVFTIVAGITAVAVNIILSPQFFLILITPVIVAAGVVSSLLRPWRNIITTTMLGLFVSAGPGLFIGALIGGNMTIFLFTAALTFALVGLIVPLAFFLQQAVETRVTTALYISISLVAIGLLALTHGNNYAIANSAIGAWNETILFIDWMLGLIGVSAFTMASIAATFSANVRNASREVIIAFGFVLLTLGHPIVRFVEISGDLIMRWELDPLYLGVFGLLIVSFTIFGRISYQLYKAGSGRAGLRFVFFMFAALFLGIVAMFADMIPLGLLVPMLFLSGVLLILSSPKRNPLSEL